VRAAPAGEPAARGTPLPARPGLAARAGPARRAAERIARRVTRTVQPRDCHAAKRHALLGALVLSVVGLAVTARPGLAEAPPSRTVILSTTTSTQDSGLLDVLVPLFERTSAYSVKTISVGTGQALALAARGEADVTLAHAPALEKQYLAEGKLLNRRLVMYNDFVLVGPAEDPARIQGVAQAAEALRRVAAARAPFVSRGDRSGTHLLELALWKQAGVEPKGAWYLESGQGMGQTLGLANDRRAYTLADRGTYLAFRKRIDLAVLVERDRPLLNIYAVMEVNPANGPRVNPAGGKAFADFMVAPDTQAVIRMFGVDRFGQPLFVPIAGKREDEVGR
jgi:tungstate transport system substrate-binding protein